MTIETTENRAKRLRMRSWRRGMKEMDLILGPFADARLSGLSDEQIAVYEVILDENDQDLYLWVTGAKVAPEGIAPLLAVIGDFARGRLRPAG